ncbi:putative ribonuclease h protein, partial [Quercus suber]
LVQISSKYLGLNFKQRGNRIAEFQFLVEKLHSNLQGWKTKLLSQAGRTTLISFFLQTLPLYTFSCFKVPETIYNKMDSIVRAFWWGHEPRERKIHLLNWDKFFYPKVAFVLAVKEFGKIIYTLEGVCVHMKILSN